MDIKIGFTDSPRELVINSSASPEEIRDQVTEALSKDSGLLELEDARGHRYLVRNSQIAHVEIGTQAARTVGFAGA